MAFTVAEATRITAIEELLNEVQIAITNLASKQQMRQLLLIRQTEVDALTQRVVDLEAQLAVLQSRLD